MYLTAFVLTPLGFLCALAGAGRLFQSRPWGVAVWWVLSILFFFVFWGGPVARGQSYYNLPALGPCALLFGIGVTWLRERFFCSARAGRYFITILVGGTVPFLVGGSLYLFQQDHVVLESTRWIRAHTRPDDLILIKANHRADVVNYPALAPFPYYAKRKVWIYSPGMASEERVRALATSRYAVITLPEKKTSWLDYLKTKIKNEKLVPENITPILYEAGFQPIYTNVDFLVYRKSHKINQ